MKPMPQARVQDSWRAPRAYEESPGCFHGGACRRSNHDARQRIRRRDAEFRNAARARKPERGILRGKYGDSRNRNARQRNFIARRYARGKRIRPGPRRRSRTERGRCARLVRCRSGCRGNHGCQFIRPALQLRPRLPIQSQESTSKKKKGIHKIIPF